MTTRLRHAHISTDVLRHAYEVDQLSLRAIAKRHGFGSHRSVQRRLLAAGVALRKGGRPRNESGRAIAREMCDRGLTYRAIAEAIGARSVSTAYRLAN